MIRKKYHLDLIVWLINNQYTGNEVGLFCRTVLKHFEEDDLKRMKIRDKEFNELFVNDPTTLHKARFAYRTHINGLVKRRAGKGWAHAMSRFVRLSFWDVFGLEVYDRGTVVSTTISTKKNSMRLLVDGRAVDVKENFTFEVTGIEDKALMRDMLNEMLESMDWIISNDVNGRGR